MSNESWDEKLAAQEASDESEDDRQYHDAALAVLDPAQRQKYLDDPFDTLILIRAFRNESPRLEITCRNLKAIAEWRKKVEFDTFLSRRIDGDEIFHQCWPEKIFGYDSYGHLILGTRICELNCDKLESFSEAAVERLVGQKLSALMAIKRERHALTGARRYKHTSVIDLSGLSTALLAGHRRALIKRVMDIGTHLYPETAWKIYILNAPLVFRAVWLVVKPWLHPKTLAKISILGSSPARAMQADGDSPSLPPPPSSS